MSAQEEQRVGRREFFRRGITVGAGLAAAGVLGGLGFPALGLRQQHATALTLDNTLKEKRLINRPAANDLNIIEKSGVKTRLGILSDFHLCATDTTASDKLTHALETLAWATPGIDAFFVLGDVSYEGSPDDLSVLASPATEELLSLFSPLPVMHLMMGNHDYHKSTEAAFESFFAQHELASLFVAKQNTVAQLPGVTAIKLNGTSDPAVDKMDYTSCYAFLAQALRETAANRPDDAILIMAHEPPEHMSLPIAIECGYYGQGTDLDLVALIAQYPQARMFSGHIHNPLDIPETVNTDLGFTSVHTSTAGSCFFVRNNLVDYDQDGSHGLVLDVMEDGRLLLHRLDFTSQKYFGEPVAI